MALTGKTISQLTKYTSSLTGNEVFPLEYNGATYHVSQSQFSSNIYTADGALTGNRVVTAGAFTLAFDGGIFIKYNTQSRLISTYYGAGTDGNNIWIGGGGLNSISGGIVWYGSYSTAIGVNACLANTTGTFNAVVGYNSMLNNTTGWGNVSVGAQSMQAGTAASFNVGIGKSALADNVTGNDNVAIGCDALRYSTGARNTGIGRSAGVGPTYNTTGINNIFIGYAAYGELGTESNRTWIGNTSTTSTWVGGNLLVGTRTDAGYKLDVNGTARVSGNLTLSGSTNYIGTGGFTGTTAKYYTEWVTSDVFNTTALDRGIGVTIRTDNTSVAGSPVADYFTTALSVDSKITNNGTSLVSTRALQANAFARSLSESGRMLLQGVSIFAHRNSPSDLSTNANNSISGLVVSTGHNYGGLSTIYTGLVYGVQSFIQFAAGNAGSVFGSSVILSQSSFSIHKNSTIVNYYAYHSNATVGTDVGITGLITNYYGLFLDSVIVRTGGTVTNRWGVYAPDVAMNHYINGTLLLGTTTPSIYKLDVNGTARIQNKVNYAPIATPGTANAGDVYYDSTTNKLRCYNGTTWNDLF